MKVNAEQGIKNLIAMHQEQIDKIKKDRLENYCPECGRYIKHDDEHYLDIIERNEEYISDLKEELKRSLK